MALKRPKHDFDMMAVAFWLEPSIVAPYSKETPRNKINAVFELSADRDGIERVINFCLELNSLHGIDLKIHRLASRCIEAQLAVTSRSDLDFLAQVCEESSFIKIASRYRLVRFDFVSEPELPVFIFN